MSNAIEEARKRFQGRNEGKVNTVEGTFPPIVQLHNKEGKVGAYVVGILDATRAVKIGKREQNVYNLKLIETNASIVKKEGKVMVDTEAKKGDLVSIFAPTRLDRVLKGIAKGIEVFIEYDGREKFVNKDGIATNPHVFTVQAGGEIVSTNSSAGNKASDDDDFE